MGELGEEEEFPEKKSPHSADPPRSSAFKISFSYCHEGVDQGRSAGHLGHYS